MKGKIERISYLLENLVLHSPCIEETESLNTPYANMKEDENGEYITLTAVVTLLLKEPC